MLILFYEIVSNNWINKFFYYSAHCLCKFTWLEKCLPVKVVSDIIFWTLLVSFSYYGTLHKHSFLFCFWVTSSFSINKKKFFWRMKYHLQWVGHWLSYFQPLNSVLVQTLKDSFCVFQLLSTKNAENDYFDQRLGCTAPKRWLKYTTVICYE